MNIAANIIGILLGLLFIAVSLMVLLHLAPTPAIPPGSPTAHLMAAMGPTGYMTFVKILELCGGIAVAIPRLRRLGLLILGPIIVNILCFHIFVAGGQGLTDPPVILVVLFALFLLVHERQAFGRLVWRRPETA